MFFNRSVHSPLGHSQMAGALSDVPYYVGLIFQQGYHVWTLPAPYCLSPALSSSECPGTGLIFEAGPFPVPHSDESLKE